MTQIQKLIITVFIFCGVMAAAYIGYTQLSEGYKLPDNLQTASSQVSESSSSSAESSQADDESKTETPERFAAPNFTMTDLEGNLITLDSLKGKPMVINFWASWCGFCVEEMPDFDEVYKELGDEVTFVMLNVTDGKRETREKGEAHYLDKGYSFKVYFDDQGMQGSDAYGVSAYPTTYFIDSNGNIAAYSNGMIDAEALKRGIELAREQGKEQEETESLKNVSWCTMDPVYSKLDAESAKRLMEEYSEMLDGEYVMLDVRTEQEHLEKRIPGSVLIPDYELVERAADELPDQKQVIFVYGRDGISSETAAKSLVEMGYNHVYDIGGMIDWPFETTEG